MRLWRVSKHRDLGGIGGVLASGRWHTRGRPIVYTAEHPALAILEAIIQVEIDRAEYPKGFHLLEIDVPGHLPSERVAPEELPENWQRDEIATRSLGVRWLASRRSLVLDVPAAVSPGGRNLLINPRHPDAGAVTILRTLPDPFDSRRFR